MNLVRRGLIFAVTLLTVAAALAAAEPENPFKDLKFRLAGPAVGGRTARAVGVPGNPLVFYVATAGGGVWKSNDGGASFKPIFDDQPTSSIGSVARRAGRSQRGLRRLRRGQHPRQRGAGRRHLQVDRRRQDRGTTSGSRSARSAPWRSHPTDPDIAFAAVLGHAFGPNPERGVYRTKDGGKTWQQVLNKDEDTGASDVTFDPNNPRHALRRLLAGPPPALGA